MDHTLNPNQLNIGIIGCGRISDLHAPGYENNPDAIIHAVCDLDPALADQRKHQWKAQNAYTDYKEMLADPGLDAVEILSPQGLHEQMVLDAAAAKKHIALQKPMTIDLESADRILDAVNKAGILFKVTDNYLFYPPIVRAKQMIDQGEIGIPSNIRMKLISGSEGGWNVPSAAWQWRLKESAAGRGLQVFDHGHHLWATAWYLLGEIERVSSWVDSVDGVIDSPATIMWKYQDAVQYGMCEYAHGTDLHIPSDYYANDEWIEITGSKGVILICRCTGKIKTGPALRLFNGHEWKDYTDLKTDWKEGFIGSTHNFIQAIQGKEAPLLSGAQGRQILRTNLAISKSARVRREVFPQELDSAWPAFYTWNRIRKQKRQNSNKGGFLALLGLGKNDKKYAAQALDLTLDLPARMDMTPIKDWDTAIGLKLTPENNVPQACFSIFIASGQVKVEKGELPLKPELTLIAPAGTWGAILLGKRKIETAFLQGRIKLEGKAEKALKLKEALNL